MNIDYKYTLYNVLIKNKQDKDGFIESHECDSLLFSGLVGCIPGIEINIKAALDQRGRWHRRPISLAPCHDCSNTPTFFQRLRYVYDYWKNYGINKEQMQKLFEVGSSSISRDMLIGLAWYAYYKKRLDISESVINYAMSNYFIMGSGTPTKTLMTPGLLSTFAWISYRLGGPSRRLIRYIPLLESENVKGFQAHLSVLHILLRNKLTGKTSNSKLLTKHASNQPNNALFQYAAGNKSTAKDLLNNKKWWPEDRLPRVSDRAEQWLFQRDFGSDWEPEESSKQHSGADFLFCYWLVNFN